MTRVWFIAVLVSISSPVPSQTAHPLTGEHVAVPSAKFPAEWYSGDGETYTSAPIIDAPSRAEVKTTTETFGTPGKPAVSQEFTHIWRDSAGRERSEILAYSTSGHPNDASWVTRITVSDPVQHCQFEWFASMEASQSKVAGVICSSLKENRSDGSWSHKMQAQKQEKAHVVIGDHYGDILITPLGSRTIEGLQAIGLRFIDTETSREGLKRQTKGREIWWSPDLYINLMAIVRTPEYAVTITTTNIKREEPAATLFYPPDNFKIQR